MKKWMIGAALLALALVLSGCAGGKLGADANTAAPGGQNAVQTIDAADAYERMNASEGYVLLDVRTAEEYAQGHIEGAILLPDSDIEARAAQVLPDKDAAIYVYCRSGRRSAAAAAQLAGMGYANVYDFGGIIDWPYGTVTGAQ